MNSKKFKEILERIDHDPSLSKDNIKDNITAELKKEDPNTYKNGFDVNYLFMVEHEPDEFTLLHLAAEYGCNRLIKFLLAIGANVNSPSSGSLARTPLHCAALKGHTETVKLLVKSEAVVNKVDAYNETPLHLAARNGHKDVVEFLLQHGADVKLLNNNDETPLHLAERNGHKGVVELLPASETNPCTGVSEVSLQKAEKQTQTR